MPWITVLFLVLAIWVLIDHLGSRRVRARVQRWSSALFAQAEAHDTSLDAHLLPVLSAAVQEAPRQTLRLSIKGARRAAPQKNWVPVEGKLFLTPQLAAAVFYADLTRWAFFSQKESVHLTQETFLAQRYLFSVLSQKMFLTREDARTGLLVGLPWWPSLAAHPELVWTARGESVVEVRWQDAPQEYAVRWQFDEQGRWHSAEFRKPEGTEGDNHLHAYFSHFRVFDQWSIPTQLTVVPEGAGLSAAVVEVQLTNWIADEPYRWW